VGEPYDDDDEDDDDSDSESFSSELVPEPKKRKFVPDPNDQHLVLTPEMQLNLLRSNIRKLKPAFLQLKAGAHQQQMLQCLFELEASHASLEELRPVIAALSAAAPGWSQKYADIFESICNIESDLE
jgi:hypothetical protein